MGGFCRAISPPPLKGIGARHAMPQCTSHSYAKLVFIRGASAVIDAVQSNCSQRCGACNSACLQLDVINKIKYHTLPAGLATYALASGCEG